MIGILSRRWGYTLSTANMKGESMKDNQQTEISSLTLYIAFSIFMCILFTIVVMIMSACGVTIPDVLITCFYGLFGGEIVVCGLIKIFKLKYENREEQG